MSKKHLMIAINWRGPYSDLEEAKCLARDQYEDGLYMCEGKEPRQRKSRLQYIGIGSTLYTRLKEDHHKLSRVTKERKIWLGEICTAEPSGKRMKFTKTTLDQAEWLHVWLLGLPLNDKKSASPPSRSVTVLNRWWKKDYETPRKRRGHPEWPDLLDFPTDGQVARSVWFGSKHLTYSPPDYV